MGLWTLSSIFCLTESESIKYIHRFSVLKIRYLTGVVSRRTVLNMRWSKDVDTCFTISTILYKIHAISSFGIVWIISEYLQSFTQFDFIIVASKLCVFPKNIESSVEILSVCSKLYTIHYSAYDICYFFFRLWTTVFNIFSFLHRNVLSIEAFLFLANSIQSLLAFWGVVLMLEIYYTKKKNPHEF